MLPFAPGFATGIGICISGENVSQRFADDF